MATESHLLPREKLQRVLSFHPHIKNQARGVLFALGVLMFWSLYSMISSGRDHSERSQLLWGVIFLSTGILFYGTFVFLKSLLTSKVRVERDHLVYAEEDRKHIIFYSEIVNFDLQTFQFQLKSGREFHFLPFIERPEYVLESFYRFNSSLLRPEVFQQVRNELILWDHKKHQYQSIRIVLKGLLASLGFSFLLLFLSKTFLGKWLEQSPEIVVVTLFYLLEGFGLYIGLAWFFQRKMSHKKAQELSQRFMATARNVAFESQCSHSKWKIYLIFQSILLVSLCVLLSFQWLLV